LSQKLLKKGFDPGTVKTVVLELVEANVVSDDRFSQMWVRSRIASKADTPRRITAALYAKRIDRGTAVRAVEECLDSETEEALLRRFVQKRLKGLMLETDGYKAVLRGQGFSEDAVQGFLESGDREGE
jgi:regulatory protein